MKPYTLPLLAITAMAGFTGSSYASVYYNNFNTGYLVGDLNGQGGWSTNPTTPDVAAINATGGVWGAAAATIGYVDMASSSAYVSHGAATPLVGNVNASFSTLFQVQDSSSLYGPGADARDTFGFRLQDAGGGNIFSFFLNPTSQSTLPEEAIAYHSFSWSTGAGAPTVALAGLGAQEEFAYTFSVDFYDAGGGVAGFNANVNGSNFSGLLGAGSASAAIDRFGATWTPTTAGAPGSNFLIFDNVSLVPEPSSAMLGLLGVSLVFIRRRR